MFLYAQINEAGFCFSVSYLATEISSISLIEIAEYDTSYIGRKYDIENKKWTDEYYYTGNDETQQMQDNAWKDQVEQAIGDLAEQVAKQALSI